MFLGCLGIARCSPDFYRMLPSVQTSPHKPRAERTVKQDVQPCLGETFAERPMTFLFNASAMIFSAGFHFLLLADFGPLTLIPMSGQPVRECLFLEKSGGVPFAFPLAIQKRRPSLKKGPHELSGGWSGHERARLRAQGGPLELGLRFHRDGHRQAVPKIQLEARGGASGDPPIDFPFGRVFC